MKIILISLAFLFPLLSSAQSADSLVVARQVDSLIKASRALSAANNFRDAEVLGEEAKTRVISRWGKRHLLYVSSLNCLAGIQIWQAHYENAESLLLEAKDTFESLNPVKNLLKSSLLNNLAIVRRNQGRYDLVEPLLLESKAIRARELGTEHQEYARGLNYLALFYQEMGRYREAETVFLEVAAIQVRTVGKDDPEYARSLGFLGVLYRLTKQFDLSEKMLLESKSIFEKKLETTAYLYSRCLGSLALLYREMGRYDQAEPLLLEARAIRAEKLGIAHPDYAATLNNLAQHYRDVKRYAEAETLYLEATKIHTDLYFKSHPDYVHALDGLFSLHIENGAAAKAAALAPELIGTEQQILRKSSAFLSESELRRKEKTVNRNSGQLAGCLYQWPGAFDTLTGLVYDNTLFYKGFLLQCVQQMHKAMAAAADDTRQLYYRWKGIQERLSVLYSKPLTERRNLAELEAQANELEQQLVRQAASFSTVRQQVGWKEVRDQLQPGEAALEFVHFQYNFPNNPDQTRYAALVLKADDPSPKFVPLFEQRQIEMLLDLHQELRSEYVNDLYSYSQRGLPPTDGRKTLRQLIWQPLEPALNGVSRIYFAPSGLLHRINLGAIPLDEENTVTSRFELVQLGCTRQLVTDKRLAANAIEDATLYGGIRYDADSTALDPPTIVLLAPASNNSDDDTPKGIHRGTLDFDINDFFEKNTPTPWPELAWTHKEVAALEAIMRANGVNVQTFRGNEATEASFKQIGHLDKSPRVLHFATHGFFFPDPRSEVRGETERIEMSEPIFKISDHPMIRSGLILAGANPAWLGQETISGAEDGILTAYEIAQMNLQNTELVVLSACETGLGDIDGNEGVYGLQRAFKIAGAKYLVMSLWQVPDRETKEFMTLFYRKMLQEKMPIRQAFSATQREMHERFLNPYLWAGFVLVE